MDKAHIKSLVRRVYSVRFLPILGFAAGIMLFFQFIRPFKESGSKLVFDRRGNLIYASLAPDGQMRFPLEGQIPYKYAISLLMYEDRHFFTHHGIDVLSLMRAIRANMASGKIVRGGSTLPMQIARLSHPKDRTLMNKFIEMAYALCLDFRFSKMSLLRIYASNVPMGGNVIGASTAAYRYLGKPLAEVTWAEAALLAVLPNTPGNPKNEQVRNRLSMRRNNLLLQLFRSGFLKETDLKFSILEPLPDFRIQYGFRAEHAVLRALEDGRNEVVTTIDIEIQKQVESLTKSRHTQLARQGIWNLAVLVAETESGKVRAYVGSQAYEDTVHGGRIDAVHALRSTGSLLKPFLIARVLDRGPYTLSSVIQDVPTFYGTFSPMNADKTYRGMVTVEETLLYSLNVPSVRLLYGYGVTDFYDFLKQANIRGLFRPAHGYGLTLVLGGAESSLWEMCRLYRALGTGGRHTHLSLDENRIPPKEEPLFGEGASWLVASTLAKIRRPGVENLWRTFQRGIPVAWKTGTSYGQKDGWAIGVNRQWVIGVWVGNVTGQGNGCLSGIESAAPILFDLFNALTIKAEPMWFDKPEADLIETECCAESGFPAGPDCPKRIKIERPLHSWKSGNCPYHHSFLVDRKTGRSVCSMCWNGIDTCRQVRYIVPPLAQSILKRNGFPVDMMPKHLESCAAVRNETRFTVVYPVEGIRILVPRDFNGKFQKVVFKAQHSNPESRLFWSLNGRALAVTTVNHEIAADLLPGEYRLSVQDEEGEVRLVRFTAFRKKG